MPVVKTIAWYDWKKGVSWFVCPNHTFDFVRKVRRGYDREYRKVKINKLFKIKEDN